MLARPRVAMGTTFAVGEVMRPMRPPSSRPGLKKPAPQDPVVLAVHLDQEARPELEEAAAAQGLRVLSVRHLQAACAALAAQQVALVIADAATRPWDREVLVEHAMRCGATVLWIEEYLSRDFIEDALQGMVVARGRGPHWRGGAHAS